MATVKVTCDVCGKEMDSGDAVQDYDMDYCRPHYIEAELRRAKDERQKLARRLEITHLKKLRELDAKISRLERGEAE